MSELTLTSGNSFFEKVFTDHLDERKIIINCEINEDVIENIMLQILKFNKEDKELEVQDRKPIFLYINSLGGDVFNGLAVVSAIKNSKTPVHAVCLAYAYSMGGLIFLASHKRYMFEYSSLLIHDGQTSLSGSAGKVKDLQKFYDNVDNKIKNIIISNSKVTVEEYDSNVDRELYMFADECKEKGLCDAIIGIDADLEEVL